MIGKRKAIKGYAVGRLGKQCSKERQDEDNMQKGNERLKEKEELSVMIMKRLLMSGG